MRKSIDSLLAEGEDHFSLIRHGAALLVLFGHSYDLSNQGPFTLWGYGIAALGVDLFFVISGFLVTGSLVRSGSVLLFLWRRALRIFPALIVAVIFCVFVVGLVFTLLPVTDYLFSSATWAYLFGKASIFGLVLTGPQSTLPGVFTQNPFTPSVNGSLWTLPWEVLMYLALASLGLCLSKLATEKRLRYLAVAVSTVAISSFLLQVCLPFFDGPRFLGDVARFGWFFFSGSMIYCYRASIVALDGVGMAVLLIALSLLTFSFPQLPLRTLLLPWIVISFAYWRPAFGAKLHPKADLSYGIYIYAFPIQQSVLVLLPDATALRVFAFSLPVTLLLAWLSWNAIERRALRLKRLLS